MITLSGLVLKVIGLALFVIAVLLNSLMFVLVELPYKLEIARQTISVLSDATLALDALLGAPVGLIPTGTQFVYQLILNKTIELLLLAAAAVLCFVFASALDKLSIIAHHHQYQWLMREQQRESRSVAPREYVPPADRYVSEDRALRNVGRDAYLRRVQAGQEGKR